jgi:transposase
MVKPGKARVNESLARLKLELDHLDMRIDEADAMSKKDRSRKRSLPTTGGHPWHRTSHRHRTHRRHRQRRCRLQGSRVRSLDGSSPREHSTGGKQKLLGISKRGNSYLRRFFVQGTRGCATAYEADIWSEQMVGPTHLASPSECGRSSPSE